MALEAKHRDLRMSSAAARGVSNVAASSAEECADLSIPAVNVRPIETQAHTASDAELLLVAQKSLAYKLELLTGEYEKSGERLKGLNRTHPGGIQVITALYQVENSYRKSLSEAINILSPVRDVVELEALLLRSNGESSSEKKNIERALREFAEAENRTHELLAGEKNLFAVYAKGMGQVLELINGGNEGSEHAATVVKMIAGAAAVLAAVIAAPRLAAGVMEVGMGVGKLTAMTGSLAVRMVGAAGITTAGLAVVATASHGVEALGHIAKGNKSASDAITDAVTDIVEDTKRAALFSSSSLLGKLAGAHVLKTGIKMATSASVAADAATTVGVPGLENIAEIAARTDGPVPYGRLIRNWLIDTTVAAVLSVFGFCSAGLKSWVGPLMVKDATVVLESAAIFGIGETAAKFKAWLDGKKLSFEEHAEQFVNSFIGIIVGESAAKLSQSQEPSAKPDVKPSADPNPKANIPRVHERPTREVRGGAQVPAPSGEKANEPLSAVLPMAHETSEARKQLRDLVPDILATVAGKENPRKFDRELRVDAALAGRVADAVREDLRVDTEGARPPESYFLVHDLLRNGQVAVSLPRTRAQILLIVGQVAAAAAEGRHLPLARIALRKASEFSKLIGEPKITEFAEQSLISIPPEPVETPSAKAAVDTTPRPSQEMSKQERRTMERTLARQRRRWPTIGAVEDADGSASPASPRAPIPMTVEQLISGLKGQTLTVDSIRTEEGIISAVRSLVAKDGSTLGSRGEELTLSTNGTPLERVLLAAERGARSGMHLMLEIGKVAFDQGVSVLSEFCARKAGEYAFEKSDNLLALNARRLLGRIDRRLPRTPFAAGSGFHLRAAQEKELATENELLKKMPAAEALPFMQERAQEWIRRNHPDYRLDARREPIAKGGFVPAPDELMGVMKNEDGVAALAFVIGAEMLDSAPGPKAATATEIPSAEGFSGKYWTQFNSMIDSIRSPEKKIELLYPLIHELCKLRTPEGLAPIRAVAFRESVTLRANQLLYSLLSAANEIDEGAALDKAKKTIGKAYSDIAPREPFNFAKRILDCVENGDTEDFPFAFGSKGSKSLNDLGIKILSRAIDLELAAYMRGLEMPSRLRPGIPLTERAISLAPNLAPAKAYEVLRMIQRKASKHKAEGVVIRASRAESGLPPR